MSNLIIDDLDHIFFKFYGKDLSGQSKIADKYKRVIRFMDEYLGQMIGKEYIMRYFDETSKNIVIVMVKNIKIQMALSIKNSQWMSAPTKSKALRKLQSLKEKIGYPDKWEIFSELTNITITKLNNDAPLIDVLNIIRYYEYKNKILNKIDTLQDPNKWSMNPHETNAYYDSQRNEIVFPAGILQTPIFDKNQSMSKNYGGIGTIIAHEITHGYDDQGQKYDYNGNIVNWWQPDDLKRFNEIANKMVKQYNNYSINGYSVNGKLTLGENLADLGALSLAFRALEQAKLNNNGQLMKQEKQEFFISYATIWRRLTTPEKEISIILSDPHSPAKFRVYMVRNIDEFYQAFANKFTYTESDNSMYLSKNDRIFMW